MHFRIILIATLAAVAGAAQQASQPQPQKAHADIRETPRGALLGFLEACRADDFRRAASFLNVRSEHRRAGAPEVLARQFKQVLDRRLSQDPARISDAPGGDVADGLEPDRELLGVIRHADRETELYLERVRTSSAAQIWLISSATVSLIPVLHSESGGNAIEQYLPGWMLRSTAFDTQLWQWFALALLTVAALLIGNLLARALIRAVQPLVRRTHSELDDSLVASIRGPMQLLIALVAYRIGLIWIAPSYLLRTYLGRILTGIIYLAIAWVFMRLVDVLTARVVAAMSKRQKSSVASVMPLARRTLKAAAVVFAILATLTSWGYDTTALLAGLGVGGLAVALAAQKTIENLFGGVAITSDKPVLVGDYCRYGDKLGTVEDIGLRSTRLRTVDRTVVTVPNSEFSSLQIENFGKRDKMSFRPVLQLGRETTPEQIRKLIPRLEDVLKTHPKMDANARVRFIAISPQSLDLEIYSYLLTPDHDEFLSYQQELLLQLLEIVADEGAALAVPRQHLVVSRDGLGEHSTRSSARQS